MSDVFLRMNFLDSGVADQSRILTSIEAPLSDLESEHKSDYGDEDGEEDLSDMVRRQQQIPRQHELTFKNKQVMVDTLSSSERVIIEEEKESDLSQSLDSFK